MGTETKGECEHPYIRLVTGCAGVDLETGEQMYKCTDCEKQETWTWFRAYSPPRPVLVTVVR